MLGVACSRWGDQGAFRGASLPGSPGTRHPSHPCWRQATQQLVSTIRRRPGGSLPSCSPPPTAVQRNSWIRGDGEEEQLELYGHNCFGVDCLLEAAIMIAFKANMFDQKGSWYWREGNKSVAIFKHMNDCQDSNFSLQLISYTALFLLSSALVVIK